MGMNFLIYDNGFEENTIIGHHDKQIKQILINQLKDNDSFMDSTWITVRDANFKEFIDKVKKDSNRIISYSGPDWNNLYGPPHERHTFSSEWGLLNECNVLHIGNTLGEYYFSFWVDFVYKNLNSYQNFDPYNLQTPLKHFMCLNRKPHRPRVELVNTLLNKGLHGYGHVSLGGDNVISLPLDIKNKEGDSSVAGEVGITNDINSLGHEDNWNSHFLNVVTETTVYTDVFITEKTLKPIIGKRPFVILGDKNIYRLLKDWGIDTFDDLFGTGYENPDYEKRIEWVVSVIENLVALDENHLSKTLMELKPRLEHNYNTFLKIAKENREKLYHLLDK